MTTTAPIPTVAPLYAVVVVHTALRRKIASADELVSDPDDEDHLTRAFHYRVPDDLRPAVRLGQLVWIPFGQRHLQGVIVAFDDQSPVEETKEIDQIVDPEPVLPQTHIDLARWISEHYLATFQQTVQSMLPPGVTQQVDIVVRLLPDRAVESVTPAQDKLLRLLQREGPLTLEQIGRAGVAKNWRDVVNQLVHHGWASKQAEVRPPTVKPKLEDVLRLRPPPAPEARTLARGPKQRAVLAYLAERHEHGEEWVPRRDAQHAAEAPASTISALAQKALVELAQREVWRDPLAGKRFVPVRPPKLTAAQDAAWSFIREDLDHPQGRPFLLQGVTGSGKTEIYLRAVGHALRQGRGVIALVPEIALTPQTIRRFGARFGSTLAVIHSHISPGERFDQWRRIRAGELRLVVGSRSALFSPVKDLGLIVLDEEHSDSYKQERTPRYHARDAAVRLAQLSGATLILGSATPDLETAYRADQGAYVRLRLPQRIVGHRRIIEEQEEELHQRGSRFQAEAADEEETLYADLPPVEVVDMRAELRSGNRSVFSRALKQSMDVALAAGEQIILFLNRRGSATFVNCRDCGHVLKCPRCDLPLTYHGVEDDLICHHCNYVTFLPPQCPECWSGRIKFFGIGTQKVEELVKEAYPQAEVVRWDLDTTGGKDAHEALLDRFIRGEADIMVGTQMIAKGLDLPRVTLVGVVAADTMIHLPEMYASERAFQLLTQVAGRAGRSVLGGKVLIQTYTPQHPAIQAARRHDYDTFYAQEMAFRREHWYPPLSKLVRLIYVHPNPRQAEDQAVRMHRTLLNKIARQGLADVDLIGPAPAFFARLRDRYRWQIIVRGVDPSALLRDLHLPLGWRVDVDPVSLL